MFVYINRPRTMAVLPLYPGPASPRSLPVHVYGSIPAPVYIAPFCGTSLALITPSTLGRRLSPDLIVLFAIVRMTGVCTMTFANFKAHLLDPDLGDGTTTRQHSCDHLRLGLASIRRASP